MNNSWYKKCMPKVKDIAPYLPIISKNIKKIDGVKSIYVWGSYASNINEPNFRVKDVDLLIKTNFNSGDLIAVDEDIIQKICTNKYLEEQGYDPLAVKFSKQFIKLTKHNIDHWTISSDKKLLHWGPIVINKSESKDIKKEAENYASKQSGYNKNKISKLSEKIRRNWYQYYCDYIGRYLSNMPSGWYQSGEENLRNIFKNTIKI